ncbi:MAG: rod shape-determining protein MreC [Saprospiraceae bacterium]|jgi:rod shape-determining protein MreC
MLSNFFILKKYSHVALFVFYEIIALFLLINFNSEQNEIFLHSSSLFSGNLLQKTSQVGDYLNLKQSNDDLLAENARLLQELINVPRPKIPDLDTTGRDFSVISARVINNSILTSRNFFTIDKGSHDSIKANMGVMTADGVAGVVKQVSEHYATILSLLHLDSRISASIKGQEYFGSISWDGQDYKHLSLSGIPKHVSLSKGLSIITNGYSTVFPKGIPIGEIDVYDISKNGVFFNISIEAYTDFSEIEHVYILKDNFADERLYIELNE